MEQGGDLHGAVDMGQFVVKMGGNRALDASLAPTLPQHSIPLFSLSGRTYMASSKTNAGSHMQNLNPTQQFVPSYSARAHAHLAAHTVVKPPCCVVVDEAVSCPHCRAHFLADLQSGTGMHIGWNWTEHCKSYITSCDSVEHTTPPDMPTGAGEQTR